MSDASLSRFLPLDCNRSAGLLTDCLSALGLSVVRSFDLQATRSVQENHCTCPHHGTSQCTCQWIVLLVYGNRPGPLTIVLDGQEGHTWLNVVDQPGQRADLHLAQKVFDAAEAEVANFVGLPVVDDPSPALSQDDRTGAVLGQDSPRDQDCEIG